jgi:hypothetical protein
MYIRLKCGVCLGVQNTPTYTCTFYLFIIYVFMIYLDRLCVLVVQFMATERRCIVLPVRYELNVYMLCRKRRPPLWSSGQSSWLHIGDVLCFLRGTNWIYICYVEESRPPLWSSGQSSWLYIQRSGFDPRRYQVFWEVMGLERDPLSLVSTTEELLGRKLATAV